ncbi:MAG: sigma-70 family RNA polymerase sigma factor [Lachnospiraceae bacterium]|nr:sigma-70 family RNA polymerase sigma factor [Lachnospiraceae bacterium]
MDDSKQLKRLTKKAIHGSAEAYGRLFEYYKKYLYRIAYASTKNEQAALDIVGECILNGFHYIRQLKEPAYFKTWITKILYNSIASYYHNNPENGLLEDFQMSAEEESISIEERMDLYQAIDFLSEKYKNIIILKYFNGLKISEIAYAMDIPEGSVKAYLYRAKTELRHLLEEDTIYEK